MTPVQMKLFSNDVERVLHVPGNLQDGNLTEMAIILDYGMEEANMREVSAQVVSALKRKGQMFQNIRLNVVKWIGDDHIDTEIMPLSMLGIGRGLEDYNEIQKTREEQIKEKRLEILAGYLKLYHARSRLLILITDGNWKIISEENYQNALQPFLYRKWIWVDENGDSKGRVNLKKSS